MSQLQTTTPTTTESPRSVTVVPRVDILEREDELLILADMPGVRPEDVDIRFENGELSLHGRRQLATAGKTVVHQEYDRANFSRTFQLSEKLAADKIRAEMKDGVLTIHLPKAEAAKPRRISVTG